MKGGRPPPSLTLVAALAVLAALAGACGDVEPAAGPPLVFASLARLAPRARDVVLSPAHGIERLDLTVANSGIEATLATAGFEPSLVDALDDAFIDRIDLFALAVPGRQLTLWHRDDELVAASLVLPSGRAVTAALYDGALAPRGFYDAEGRSMSSRLRARPVALRRITSRYGQRFDAFTGAASFHRGVDYGVPVETPVLAAGRGRVTARRSSASAGNFVKLSHDDGYESLYLHLDRVFVRRGDIVARGQEIAASGNTGRTTGPHLHYELHLAGVALDPLTTLPASTKALGPSAKREHAAFIKTLEAMHDRRTNR